MVPSEPKKSATSKRKAFLLRLPRELYNEIHALADHELRSVNGQIEYLLRQAVRARRDGSRESGG